MTSEQELSLSLYSQRHFEVLRVNPAVGLEAIIRLNEEVNSFFDCEGFLSGLNERLFKGRGELKPLRHSYTLEPHEQEQLKSRFARLFSVNASLSNVYSRTELWVKRSDLDTKFRKHFDDLVLGVCQIVDMETGNYKIFIDGSLVFRYRHRYSNGDWDGKPARLSRMSNGRSLEFSLKQVPEPEEISKVMFEQAEELLKEMTTYGLVPNINDV